MQKKLLIVNDFWVLKGGVESLLRVRLKNLEKQGRKFVWHSMDKPTVINWNENEEAEFHNVHWFASENQAVKLISEPLNRKIPTTIYMHDHSYFCPIRNMMWEGKLCDTPVSNKCWHHMSYWALIREIKECLGLVKRADKIKVMSQYMADRIKFLGMPAEKVFVDPLPMNPIFRNLNKKRDIDILFIAKQQGANLKGADIAFRIHRLLPELNFYHISDSNWTTAEGMLDFYNRSKIVIVPSRVPEGYGLVALEAKKCGCKTIVSDVGALPETNPDLLAGVGDVDGFRAGILMLLGK